MDFTQRLSSEGRIDVALTSSWGIVLRATDWLGLVQQAEYVVAGKVAKRLGVQGPSEWSHAWGPTCLATPTMEAVLSFL